MTEIELYKSSCRAIRLILLCSIFVLLGIWGIISAQMPPLISWLCIGFFGLGYPVGIYHLLDRHPQIIISEIGIFDRTTHEGFINWEIINDAYLIDIHNQKFICLVVDDNFRPSKKKSKIYKRFAKLNETIGAQELNIPLGQIKINEPRLTEFILAMRTATKSSRPGMIQKALKEKNSFYKH